MQQTIQVRRASAIAHKLRRSGLSPAPRPWRAMDPPSKTVSELGPDDFHHRVVIRGEFIGTVYGTLLDAHPHRSFIHFTCVQVYGHKLLTFRDDVEVIVLDDLHSG